VRYAVPHRLRLSSLAEGEVRLQMRVTRPIEAPVWVEVHSGDRLVTRKGEPYARPGEMVTVTLKPKDYVAMRSGEAVSIAIVPR